jgi:hypothetical protein
VRCLLSGSAMLTSFTFWLVVLVVLFAYLCVSLWLHQRAAAQAEEARLHAIEREYPARAFDTSAIASQLRHVRQDYAATAQRRWRLTHYRSELISAARRLVTSLAYFRHAKHEHELHKHDA